MQIQSVGIRLRECETVVVSCALKSLSFMARRAGPNIVVADACYKCARASGHGDRKHTPWYRFIQLSFCLSSCALISELRVQAASAYAYPQRQHLA